jgi:carbon-monoxide dehydrogenase large subunit
MGQALLEHCVYDPDSGQLLTGSYMDYAMPRADDPRFQARPRVHALHAQPARQRAAARRAPSARRRRSSTPCSTLAPLGVKELDMPATPHRVWQAIQSAKA